MTAGATRRTVLLVGAYGQGNPGDEALCAAFCAALGDHDLIVASGDPAGTRDAFGVSSIPATPRAMAGALGRVDAVVVGGGTVFKTLHPSTGRAPSALLANTAGLVAAARATRTTVAMVGVGAGDLVGWTPRALARWIVPRVDLVVMRDEESAAVLGDAGARPPFWIGADPTWTLAPPAVAAGNTGEGTITVALSHLAGGAGLVNALASALRPYCAEHAVRLQPWQTGRHSLDAAMAATLHAELHGRADIVDPPADLLAATHDYGGDELVVGARFHAVVAAARAGTPFVAIAHEPKLAGLARRLGQVSVPAHATAEVIAAAIEHGLGSERVPTAAVDGEVLAAGHAMELVRLMLDRGETTAPHDVPTLPLSTGSATW